MSEQEMVEQVLARIQRPKFVEDIRHALDLDSEGEPAVRVWVVVQDDTIRREEFDEPLDRLRAAIVNANADYNRALRWTCGETHDLVKRAEQSFQAWHAVRDTPEARVRSQWHATPRDRSRP